MEYDKAEVDKIFQIMEDALDRIKILTAKLENGLTEYQNDCQENFQEAA